MKITPFLRKFWKTILCALVISYALFTPASDLPRFVILRFPHADKLIHCILFLSLEFIILLDIIKLYEKPQPKTIGFLTFLVLLYGGVAEIIQHYFIKGRSGSWFDFMADGIGVGIAICFIHIYLNRSGISSEMNDGK
jgi:VanZ family protein